MAGVPVAAVAELLAQLVITFSSAVHFAYSAGDA